MGPTKINRATQRSRAIARSTNSDFEQTFRNSLGGGGDIVISGAPAPRKKKDKKLIIIIGLLIALVVVFVLTLVLNGTVGGGKKNTADAYDPIYRFANYLNTGDENNTSKETVLTYRGSKAWNVFYEASDDDAKAYYEKAAELARAIPEVKSQEVNAFREEVTLISDALREFRAAEPYTEKKIIERYNMGVSLVEIENNMRNTYEALKNIELQEAKDYVSYKMKIYNNTKDLVLTYKQYGCINDESKLVFDCLPEDQKEKIAGYYAQNSNLETDSFELMKELSERLFTSVRTTRNMAVDGAFEQMNNNTNNGEDSIPATDGN